jgi:hypothetical protein
MGEKMTGYVYEIICASSMIHGIMGDGKIDNIPRRFCKKVLRLARSTIYGTAECELGRDSRRGEMFCRTAKFQCRILQMEQEKMYKYCYDWQIGNLKWQS